MKALASLNLRFETEQKAEIEASAARYLEQFYEVQPQGQMA